MASPLNGMELAQAYRMNEVRQAQAMQEMQLAQMLTPYRMEGLQANALRDRAAIEHQRNALGFQRENAAEENALRRQQIASGDRRSANALAIQERRGQQAASAREAAASRADWVFDAQRGVQVNRVTGQVRPVTMQDGSPLGDKLSTDQQNELKDIRRTSDAATKLAAMFKPEYVGLKGSMGEFWDKYGSQVVPGAEGDSSRIQFRAMASDLENQYIKAISGATVPTSEVPRLQRALPTPSDSPAQYAAKLKIMQANLEGLPTIISGGKGGAPAQSRQPSGGLSQEELQELAQLRKRFGR